MATGVRRAGRADVGVAARVLGAAFAHDPVCAWIAGPRRAARLDRTLVAYFHAVLAQLLRRPDSDVDVRVADDGRGAAVWLPSHRYRLSLLEQLRATPAAMRGFGPMSGRRGLPVEAVMHRHHPLEPHQYLWFLGARPQGQGTGDALLRTTLEELDVQGVPAYLENSNPRNAPLYRRHGFQERDALPVPPGCPPLVPMWRPVGG